MKYDKIDNNHVKFSFKVSKPEFEHALDHAYDHIKDDVEVKGFRKGQVTRKVYEQRYGVESLYNDALNHAISHKFNDALMVKEFVIVSDPTNIDVNVEDLKNEDGFDISFDVAIRPEVTLGDYKNLEVEVEKVTVSKEEIEKEVESLLSINQMLEPKEEGHLENGDTAIFDFEGFVDDVPFEGGKADNFSLKIGSGQFIPGFEEQMVGLKAGDKKDLKVTFPEEYQAPELAGKEAIFKVLLHEIKVEVKNELNDEWVKTLNRENVNTVKELEDSIKADLTKTKESEAKNKVTELVLKQIVENTKMDVPKEMYETEVSNYKKQVENQAKQYQLDLDTFISLTGQTSESFEKQANEHAKLRVDQTLVLEEIAKVEKFEITDKERNYRYEELASHYKMDVSEIKKYLSDDVIDKDIAFEKALELVTESAIIK
ncbi:MAG: trigger factor [Acholeplasmataceae bacterium]